MIIFQKDRNNLTLIRRKKIKIVCKLEGSSKDRIPLMPQIFHRTNPTTTKSSTHNKLKKLLYSQITVKTPNNKNTSNSSIYRENKCTLTNYVAASVRVSWSLILLKKRIIQLFKKGERS